MAKFSGPDLYIEWNGEQVSGHQRTLEFTRNTNMIDTSSAASRWNSYIAGQKDGSISVTWVDDYDSAAGTTYHGNMTNGASGTITWGPQGTATGKPKYSYEAIISEVSTAYPYEAEVEYTISLQPTGQYVLDFDENGDTY